MALLSAVIVLFAGALAVDLYFFNQVTRFHRFESRVAMVLFDWSRLVDQTSGLLLSNETIGSAHGKWKRGHDAYRAAWPSEDDELKELSGGDALLLEQIAWVRDTLDLGLKQMDLIDRYMANLVASLRAKHPEMLDRDSMSSIGDAFSKNIGQYSADLFYLNTVRNAAHLIDNMMSPILGSAHARFQTQIADRVAVLNSQNARIRVIFIFLILGVLIAFLLRILKLNLHLISLVKRRTSELEKLSAEQEDKIRERTEELTAANEHLRKEILERKNAETQVLRLNRLYATLSNVNQSIVWIRQIDRLQMDICRIAVEYGEFQEVWIGIIDQKANQMEACSYSSGSGEAPVETLDLAAVQRGGGPTGEALRSGKTIIRNGPSDNPDLDPWIDESVARERKSTAAFPLFIKGRLAGALSIYAGESDFFGPDDIKLLSEMAKDISFALEFMESEEKRNRAEQGLQCLNLELEERVKQRTFELVEKNSELDRMNRLFVGREIRMIELKNRIAELEERMS